MLGLRRALEGGAGGGAWLKRRVRPIGSTGRGAGRLRGGAGGDAAGGGFGAAAEPREGRRVRRQPGTRRRATAPRSRPRPRQRGRPRNRAKADGRARSTKDRSVEGRRGARKPAKAKTKGKAARRAREGRRLAKPARRSEGGGGRRRRPRTARPRAPTPATEEPAGPVTPPIKLSALREEMSRPPARHDEHAADTAEREQLEQLAAEINKAREGLRQDTARLEAMLAARDARRRRSRPAARRPRAATAASRRRRSPSPLDNLAKAIRGHEARAGGADHQPRRAQAGGRRSAADAGRRRRQGDGRCKPEVAAELAAEIASRAPRPAHAELKPHAELK